MNLCCSVVYCRTNLPTTMYSNSMIGVGMASTLYHTSRGKVRRLTRWGDYAMIATSTLVGNLPFPCIRPHIFGYGLKIVGVEIELLWRSQRVED